MASAAKHTEYKVADVLSVDTIKKRGSKKGAGRLVVELFDGLEKLTVVTAYSNVEVGKKVIFAPEGSMVRGGLVRRRKEAGYWNEGVICGPSEMGCQDNASFCSCIILDHTHLVGDYAPIHLPASLPLHPAAEATLVQEDVLPIIETFLLVPKLCSAASQELQSPMQKQVETGQCKKGERMEICNMFIGEWDEEGVFFYQAFNNEIANWALKNQKFGGPEFNPVRMTWIKPSFAWMLYRAGYGRKDKNQSRILKVKLPHQAVAEILSRCRHGHGNGGGEGRVQWDPARTLLRSEGREPARSGGRAIQIGLKDALSCYYVSQALSIVDVTALAHEVEHAHGLAPDDCQSTVEQWLACGRLPNERSYMPQCNEDTLSRLRLCG